MGEGMRVVLAGPRGFCAGVDRAIAIVDRALARFGAPVYVRHEIVHNRLVVEGLRRKGAIFVDELGDVPDGATVIFSAHGVAKAVKEEAAGRPLRVLDATCPLVYKVHREAERLDRQGYRVVLIGHKGHPEVVGTTGQLPPGRMEVVARPEEVAAIAVDGDRPVAYITQTTLSVDETAEVVAAFEGRFPQVRGPAKEDICYATQNRQNAVKSLARECDLILVLGSKNSSNSNRLREVAERCGCAAHLVDSHEDVDPAWFDGVRVLGVTAGASTPEVVVRELLDRFADRIASVEQLVVGEEELVFPLPRELAGQS